MSNFSHHVEYSDDSVRSAHCKHVTSIRKVNCEDWSGKVAYSCARFEIEVAVEHLDFIVTTSSCKNQVSCGLEELGRIHLALLRTVKPVIPFDVFDELGRAQIVNLHLFIWAPRSAKNITLVQVQRISTNVGVSNLTHRRTLAHIPNVDHLVPTS